MIKGLRTRVYSIQEGWDLCCAIMRKGYDGVLNESSRYNDSRLKAAFENADYCWIAICGTADPMSGCLRIVSIHDKEGKKQLLDVCKSRFIEKYELDVRKTNLPKSLKSL